MIDLYSSHPNTQHTNHVIQLAALKALNLDTVSACVYGDHLDNAEGDAIFPMRRGKNQEFVVEFLFLRGKINLATLIAQARKNGDNTALERITQGAAEDMHEPDQQGIRAEVKPVRGLLGDIMVTIVRESNEIAESSERFNLRTLLELARGETPTA